tara:strand:- start:197 stop:376 length:180 start_codon:yes stop_codon:yes gene_type:complete
MKKKILPALGIIIVTVILVVINEFTELTFITDYALIFIIAGMFFGLWLSKISDKANENK